MAVIIDQARQGPGSRAPLTRAEPLLFAVGALLLTLAVRLPTLGRQSFWTDEVFTAEAIAMDWPGLIKDRLENGHFPSYFMLLKALGLAGAADALLRLPSALFEGAAAAVFAVIALRLGGRIAALAMAFFFAFLPILFFYGQEARPYAAMLFFLGIMTIGQIALLGNGNTPEGTGAKSRGERAATLGAVLAALMIPAAIVSVAASHAGLAIAGGFRRDAAARRPILRHVLVTWVVIGAAALALLPSVIELRHEPGGLMKWQATLSPAVRFHAVALEVFGLSVTHDADLFLPAGWEIVPALGLATFALAGVWFGRKQRAVRYLAASVAVTLVGFLVIGSVTAMAGRYLLGLVPAYLLLASIGAAALLRVRSWLRLLAGAVLAGTGAMMALQTLDASQSDARYDWRRLGSFLSESGLGGAAIITNEPNADGLFRHVRPDDVQPVFQMPDDPDFWQYARAPGLRYVLAFNTGDRLPDGLAMGRTVCSFHFGDATFFALAPHPADLPAPLRGCAGKTAG